MSQYKTRWLNPEHSIPTQWGMLKHKDWMPLECRRLNTMLWVVHTVVEKDGLIAIECRKDKLDRFKVCPQSVKDQLI